MATRREKELFARLVLGAVVGYVIWLLILAGVVPMP
jgi:hypothetical protein